MGTTEPLVNNAFSYSGAILDSLQKSLSPERLETYLQRSQNNQQEAIRLHTWNTAVSAAFYGPLQGLEITLRNAMHRELERCYGCEWYDDPAVGLDMGATARIASARHDLRRGKYPDDPPHMVAALSFGFWVALLGSGGRKENGTKASYEMTIWRPCARHAFSHFRTNRKSVHKPLDHLRMLRNRIAHHEPIFGRHLKADHDSLLRVLGWICPQTQAWVRHHSRVMDLLTRASHDPAVLF